MTQNRKTLTSVVFLFFFISSSVVHAADMLNLNSYSPTCKQSVLQSLGWQITSRAPNTQVWVSESGSCWSSPRSTFYHAQLQIPANATYSDYNADLDRALDDPATTCMFQKYFDWAIDSASSELKNNFGYLFIEPVGGLIINKGDARMNWLKAWQEIPCENGYGNGDTSRDKHTCFMPIPGRIHTALGQLRHGVLETECLTGLELVEYTALDDLFGPKIDHYFTAKDFYVGSDWWDSQSIMGQNSRYNADWYGLQRAQEGPNALIGAPGQLIYIHYDQDDKTLVDKGASYLDSPINMAENFVITGMTQNAADALIARGGTQNYKGLLAEIWQRLERLSPYQLKELELVEAVAHTLTPDDMPRPFSLDPKAVVFLPPPAADENFKTLVQLLNDPFLSETTVYVHPVGFKTLAWHLVRLARLNPRTPYELDLYPDVVHGEFFNRWLKSKLDSCSQH